MRALLIISSILATCAGCALFVSSLTNPLHEVEAGLAFIVAAVLFSTYAIIDAVIGVRQDLKSNGLALDRLGAALATPPELPAGTDHSAPTGGVDTYLVQLSDGVRGTFTRDQISALLDRGIIDRRAFILPAGASTWIRLSELASH